MSQDTFFIEKIKQDFNVEQVSICGDSSLFAALRKGGTGTDAMGTWHFVAACDHVSESSPNFHNLQIMQWHIPRYQMANCLRTQNQSFQSESYDKPVLADWMPFKTLIYGRNQLTFQIDEAWEFSLEQAFIEEMKSDLPLLELAIEKIRVIDGKNYCLPKAKTSAGHPIESGNEDLVRAIAFEKITRPRMTFRNFGIYSAFCTYCDFDITTQMRKSTIQDLLNGQFQYNPEEISDEIHDFFLNTQMQLLGNVIWARGIKSSMKDAVPVLAQCMANLTQSQRTQFVLMNGMHHAGLFLPLATIHGLCSFDDYVNYMCDGLQPDSPEEQGLRIETAYIKLFGELFQGRKIE